MQVILIININLNLISRPSLFTSSVQKTDYLNIQSNRKVSDQTEAAAGFTLTFWLTVGCLNWIDPELIKNQKVIAECWMQIFSETVVPL